MAPRREREDRRLIPAHAGKTAPHDAGAPPAPAHPRSRGENPPLYPRARTATGSSPLTRGKPHGSSSTPPHRRLIPAHAGKTRALKVETLEVAAHPRSRGENGDDIASCLLDCGSSPLTRGKPARRGSLSIRRRLIPAHAGKTRRAGSGRGPTPAHPRSRGENGSALPTSRPIHGSSPLTRGKPDLRLDLEVRLRLIPAHAGKTTIPAANPASSTAHPRSRGENRHLSETVRETVGSSPLTRGKPRELLHTHSLDRLIPAHAGKT